MNDFGTEPKRTRIPWQDDRDVHLGTKPWLAVGRDQQTAPQNVLSVQVGEPAPALGQQFDRLSSAKRTTGAELRKGLADPTINNRLLRRRAEDGKQSRVVDVPEEARNAASCPFECIFCTPQHHR